MDGERLNRDFHSELEPGAFLPRFVKQVMLLPYFICPWAATCPRSFRSGSRLTSVKSLVPLLVQRDALQLLTEALMTGIEPL